jgi:hypothetical protein
VAACPVDAIVAAHDLPEQWRHYASVNADYYTADGSG